MDQYTLNRIGTVRVDGDGMRIEVEPRFRPGLTGLEGFGHLNVIWWFSDCDTAECRGRIQETAPYKKGPQVLGVFATRSPMRPNPLALSCVQVTWMDRENGVIGIAYTDAHDGTPVLDIKPYTPSIDRVGHPALPGWCAHWPDSCETSGDFDWEAEFNF